MFGSLRCVPIISFTEFSSHAKRKIKYIIFFFFFTFVFFSICCSSCFSSSFIESHFSTFQRLFTIANCVWKGWQSGMGWFGGDAVTALGFFVRFIFGYWKFGPLYRINYIWSIMGIQFNYFYLLSIKISTWGLSKKIFTDLSIARLSVL